MAGIVFFCKALWIVGKEFAVEERKVAPDSLKKEMASMGRLEISVMKI